MGPTGPISAVASSRRRRHSHDHGGWQYEQRQLSNNNSAIDSESIGLSRDASSDRLEEDSECWSESESMDGTCSDRDSSGAVSDCSNIAAGAAVGAGYESHGEEPTRALPRSITGAIVPDISTPDDSPLRASSSLNSNQFGNSTLGRPLVRHQAAFSNLTSPSRTFTGSKLDTPFTNTPLRGSVLDSVNDDDDHESGSDSESDSGSGSDIDSSYFSGSGSDDSGSDEETSSQDEDHSGDEEEDSDMIITTQSRRTSVVSAVSSLKSELYEGKEFNSELHKVSIHDSQHHVRVAISIFLCAGITFLVLVFFQPHWLGRRLRNTHQDFGIFRITVEGRTHLLFSYVTEVCDDAIQDDCDDWRNLRLFAILACSAHLVIVLLNIASVHFTLRCREFKACMCMVLSGILLIVEVIGYGQATKENFTGTFYRVTGLSLLVYSIICIAVAFYLFILHMAVHQRFHMLGRDVRWLQRVWLPNSSVPKEAKQLTKWFNDSGLMN